MHVEGAPADWAAFLNQVKPGDFAGLPGFFHAPVSKRGPSFPPSRHEADDTYHDEENLAQRYDGLGVHGHQLLSEDQAAQATKRPRPILP